MTYDLIVLGGGPAGYHAAERASISGLKTLLIEKQSLGGVCLNEGCIPTKVFLYASKLYEQAQHGSTYGVSCENAVLDHMSVIKRKDKVVRTLTAGVRSSLIKCGVTIVEGQGMIAGRTPDAYEVSISSDRYCAKNLLVATGSIPIVPPIPGVAEGMNSGTVITSRELLMLESIPTSLTIIGGGVIGIEMASYFNSAGSKVTVIEMLDRVGGGIDRELGEILQRHCEKQGITFMLNSRVTSIEGNSTVVESEGKSLTVTGEKILLSTGRRPNTQNIGLENISAQLERGCLKVDERCKTNMPGVYAAGDINGVSMLAHTAYREAEVCVNNMIGKKDRMRYHAIPTVVYTYPELACVGETEESAGKKGMDFEVVSLPMNHSGRYLAETENGKGLCKVLVNRETRAIIGVHLLGNYVSEIIYGAALMIETEMRAEDLSEVVFPHPSVSEVLRLSLLNI